MEVRPVDVMELGQAATGAVTDAIPKGMAVTSRAVTQQPVTPSRPCHGVCHGRCHDLALAPMRPSRKAERPAPDFCFWVPRGVFVVSEVRATARFQTLRVKNS